MSSGTCGAGGPLARDLKGAGPPSGEGTPAGRSGMLVTASPHRQFLARVNASQSSAPNQPILPFSSVVSQHRDRSGLLESWASSFSAESQPPSLLVDTRASGSCSLHQPRSGYRTELTVQAMAPQPEVVQRRKGGRTTLVQPLGRPAAAPPALNRPARRSRNDDHAMARV